MMDGPTSSASSSISVCLARLVGCFFQLQDCLENCFGNYFGICFQICFGICFEICFVRFMLSSKLGDSVVLWFYQLCNGMFGSEARQLAMRVLDERSFRVLQ